MVDVVCFSEPALTLLGGLGGVLGVVISTLFWQLLSSKNTQIASLREENTGLRESNTKLLALSDYSTRLAEVGASEAKRARR